MLSESKPCAHAQCVYWRNILLNKLKMLLNIRFHRSSNIITSECSLNVLEQAVTFKTSLTKVRFRKKNPMMNDV